MKKEHRATAEALDNIRSISILVLALNEEKHIQPTIEAAMAALRETRIKDYEILVIDGGSRDRTETIVQAMSQRNDKLSFFKNKEGDKGLGSSFRKGVGLATKEYVGWLPGDNDILPEGIKNILKKIGETDIIIPYSANFKARPFIRRILSRIYTRIFNLLFGLKLNYFNGPCFF